MPKNFTRSPGTWGCRTALARPRAASPASAARAAAAVSANVTSPSWVLWTSARFTHTGSAPTSSAPAVATRRLGTNDTAASSSSAIIRSRYVLRTAWGVLTWGTPRAASSLSRPRIGTCSHIMNTPCGRSGGRLPMSSGLWTSTRKPRASRCLPVRRRISVSSVSRPGECACSRKMPQQNESLTCHPPCRSRLGLLRDQRFCQGYVLGPVDVYNCIDDLGVDRLTRHQPPEVVPQPLELGRRRLRPRRRREQIDAGGDQRPGALTDPSDAPGVVDGCAH